MLYLHRHKCFVALWTPSRAVCISDRHTKKAWSPTVVVPRSEAFALPLTGEQQREVHAGIRKHAYTCHNHDT